LVKLQKEFCKEGTRNPVEKKASETLNYLENKYENELDLRAVERSENEV